jgi:hypothetical protein
MWHVAILAAITALSFAVAIQHSAPEVEVVQVVEVVPEMEVVADQNLGRHTADRWWAEPPTPSVP